MWYSYGYCPIFGVGVAVMYQRCFVGLMSGARLTEVSMVACEVGPGTGVCPWPSLSVVQVATLPSHLEE